MKRRISTKDCLLSVGLLVTLQAVPLIASAGVSANLGITSNYLFRGVTQTDGSTATQGGLDYEHASGLYVGGWGSNVDFGDGTKPFEGSPYCDAHDGGLGKGCVYNPLRAKLFYESLGGKKYSTSIPYIFTQDEDPWVPGHLLAHGVANCLEHRYYRYAAPPGPGA